jgi:hypothetical protein
VVSPLLSLVTKRLRISSRFPDSPIPVSLLSPFLVFNGLPLITTLRSQGGDKRETEKTLYSGSGKRRLRVVIRGRPFIVVVVKEDL